MYLNVDEIVTKCELLAEQFPDEVTLSTLPETTHDGRPMHLLRIKGGPKTPRHGLYIEANIHAREWGTADILMHFVEELLVAFRDETDLTFGDKTFAADSIRTAMRRVELFVVPCVNPDGRAFSQQPGTGTVAFPQRMWRKNRRDNGDPDCFGVDLNRNFDWIWDYRTAVHTDALIENALSGCNGYNNTSDNPCDDRYHGDKPFSEPEARNVRSVLDDHPHIRVFVDLHGVLGKIMTPWADDEVQTTDPEENFTNPTHDGKRGLRDAPYPTGNCASAPPHPDGPGYHEFMHAVDQARFADYATLQRDALFEVAETDYATGTSFLEMYGMSGNANDYAYSRHLANPALSKVDSYIYEFEQRSGPNFQPPFEEPPGPDDMIHVIRDVAASLAALLVNTDRMPIVEHTPATIEFGNVRVGMTRQRTITLSNHGVRGFDIGSVSLVGAAGPLTVGPAAQSHLDPAEEATITVTAAPTQAGVATPRVAIEFAFAGETIRDVRMVRCSVRGCTVGANACVAPTFNGAGWLTCLGRLLFYGALIIALAIPALFSAEVRCTIKKLYFRILHCRDGHHDPCRTL